jgi:hypothetical protein
MEEIIIDKIEWSAPEYNHKKRTPDWFWAIGLVTLAVFIASIWARNYLFALFVIVSGGCLILFTLRNPRTISLTIDNDGITIGKTLYKWKEINGFKMKKGEPYSRLLIETKKYFLPIYNVPVPEDLTSEVRESLLKILPISDHIEESASMQFMEKIGF